MPRQNRRRDEQPRPRSGGLASNQRTEVWRGEQFNVRQMSGGDAGRSFRCPGCDQMFTGNVPHVVTWSEFDREASDRRHWHTACWQARDRRSTGVQRSRSAPRY